MGAADDGQVDAERDLRGRIPQPLRNHVQRNPIGGQPVTGGTMPEAMGLSPLTSGTGRLRVEGGMLDASPQMPQYRLRGQTNNDIPWTIRGGEGRTEIGRFQGQ